MITCNTNNLHGGNTNVETGFVDTVTLLQHWKGRGGVK